MGNVQAAIGCGGCGADSDFRYVDNLTTGNTSLGHEVASFGGGGGGSYTPPSTPAPQAPVCTLDLTKDKITWTTQNATVVDIKPTTNSPAVPGKSVQPAGTVVFSGTWESIKYGANSTKLINDVKANGIPGAVISSTYGFYGNKATADRICEAILPGTVNGTYKTRPYSSPKNNFVYIWNGSSWTQQSAKNYNSHFDGAGTFTCVTAAQSPYDLSGMHSFVPPLQPGTHTYNLTANGPGGQKVCTATVVVPEPPKPAPTCTLTAHPTSIEKGESAKLTWTSKHATSGSINGGVGAIATSKVASGHTNVSPTATTNYTATFTGPGGEVTCSAKVKVTTPPPTPHSPTCELDVTKSKVTWDSTNAHEVIITPTTNSPTVGSNLGLSGSKTFNPVLGVGTHTYRMEAVGHNYEVAVCEDTVVVSKPPTNPPKCWIGFEGKNTLAWKTDENAKSYTVAPLTDSPEVGTNLPLMGSHTFNPPLEVGKTHKYRMTVYDNNHKKYVCTATKYIPPTSNGLECTLSVSPSEINLGEDAELTWTSSGASTGSIDMGVGDIDSGDLSGGSVTVSPTESKTYTATFMNNKWKKAVCTADIVVKKVDTPAPVCTLTANKTLIDPGEEVELEWVTLNSTAFVLDNGIGTSTPTANGTHTVNPTQTTTYTGTAYGENGEVITCDTTVTIETEPGPICTLSISASSINTGESVVVSWTSQNTVSGFINNNIGTTTPVSSGSMEVFPPEDTTYVGEFLGTNGEIVTCTAAVTVATGGCQGSCGGGLNPPNVTLLAGTPGGQVLGVSLAQIPYTGFDAGPVLALLFWLAVVVWSLGIAYILAGKGQHAVLHESVLQNRTSVRVSRKNRRRTQRI